MIPQLWGRPRDMESPYLLTGMADCGCCNGGLFVRSGSSGRSPKHFYKCAPYHRRGRAICTNGFEIPMRPFDTEFLTSLERYVFNPAVLTRTVDETLEALTNARTRGDAEALQKEDKRH